MASHMPIRNGRAPGWRRAAKDLGGAFSDVGLAGALVDGAEEEDNTKSFLR
jgi:hypothetical protein